MGSDLLIIFFLISFAYFAYRIETLTKSGALLMVIIGATIQLGFGLRGLLLIGLFFITSSFLSKWKKGKKLIVQSIVEKNDKRDWLQVLANGSLASIFSIFYFISEQQLDFLFAYTVAIAAANADTWASEIGVLSKKDPWMIYPLQKVSKGTSGAVSLLGTWAGLMGALVIGVAAYVLWYPLFSLIDFCLFTALGFVSMIIDSLFGQTIQVKFRCSICQLITEKNVHCGKKTVYEKGIPYITNDMVNFLSILVVSLFALILI